MLIEFPDVPEAAAVADTAADAPVQAADGLEAALQMYVDARRPLPAAQYADGDAVTLRPGATAKLLLANEMIREGVRKADLARSLGVCSPRERE